MKALKGFDKDLRCRGFQYEVGKEYEEKEAELCNKGFHACEFPLDVLGYYPPAGGNRYCEVELNDNGERHTYDTKVCGTRIKIGAEIDIKGLIKATFDYVKERCTTKEICANNTALTGGYSSALTGGNWSVVYGGKGAKVRAKKGSVLALQHWENYELKGIKFKEVDGVKIKEDTYYELKNGRFVESGE